MPQPSRNVRAFICGSSSAAAAAGRCASLRLHFCAATNSTVAHYEANDCCGRTCMLRAAQWGRTVSFDLLRSARSPMFHTKVQIFNMNSYEPGR